MAYNEFFECAQLDYITKRRILEQETKKQLTFDEEQKKRQAQIYQQEICFEKIGNFLGKSDIIVRTDARLISFLASCESEIFVIGETIFNGIVDEKRKH